jgi:hypothetical protein
LALSETFLEELYPSALADLEINPDSEFSDAKSIVFHVEKEAVSHL